MANWYLFQSGLGLAQENMAWDEALLEASSRIGSPVLRFYGWSQPAASFGYFQRYGEIAGWTSLRPLIRRPTGGGLVSHDFDWTYSLTVPPSHWWYRLKAEESYQRIHHWIREAFARLETTTELSPNHRQERPGQCFAGAEKFDLLVQGKKIAGAAQRRARHGLLIQGSIQPRMIAASRSCWEEAMTQVPQEEEAIQWSEWAPDRALEERTRELSETKYSRDSYNQRR